VIQIFYAVKLGITQFPLFLFCLNSKTSIIFIDFFNWSNICATIVIRNTISWRKDWLKFNWSLNLLHIGRVC